MAPRTSTAVHAPLPHPGDTSVGELYGRLLTVSGIRSSVGLASTEQLASLAHSLLLDADAIVASALHPVRRILAVASKESIAFFDLDAHDWIRTLTVHQHGEIRKMCWNPANPMQMALALRDGSIKLISISSFLEVNEQVVFLDGTLTSDGEVDLIRFSPCGRFLAFSNRRKHLVQMADLSDDAFLSSKKSWKISFKVDDLEFSPSSTYLLATSHSSSYFTLIDVSGATAHRMSVGEDQGVQSFAWTKNPRTVNSSDLRALSVAASTVDILLINRTKSSVLSAIGLPPRIYFQQAPPGKKFQFSQEVLNCHTEIPRLGKSYVSLISWSPNGSRLAVALKHCPLVAIYGMSEITPRGLPQLYPIGFLQNSDSDENGAVEATQMEFHAAFDKGALLCISWSNGRISFYPMLFD